MRLFGWFRRTPDPSTETEERSPRRWTWLGGRRILTNTPYVFPKDKVESDRLDLQHHMLKVAIGKNYRAPIHQPRAILDVACGTGIWGREMALEFKRAQVIGFDIDRTPMEAVLARLGPSSQFPPNFRFIEADALKPFPFEDAQFDFTHARFIGSFVPIARWPDLVAEMVRVTKRGGYVEIVDGALGESESQAFNVLQEAFKRLAAARGLHAGAGAYLADYLRQAGLQRVQERRVFLGAEHHMERERRLLIADFVATATNIRPLMLKAGILSEAESTAALERLPIEVRQVGATWPIIFAFSINL